MLAFLALLGAPYIYDISSLRVNVRSQLTSSHAVHVIPDFRKLENRTLGWSRAV